jgi:hypothetical protein
MSRPSLFVLVVLIAAAAVAGLVALTRSSAATEAGAPSGSAAGQAQISYRLKQIDRLEADLRKRIAAASKPIATPAVAPQQQTVYVRQPSLATVAVSHHDDDHEGDDHESEERDD